MNVAVIGTSRKENEKRVAIHPGQLKTIPKEILRQLFFEKGYGIPFGMDDTAICSITGNHLESRETLFKDFNAFLIPKPVEEDFEEMQEGSLVWGWTHSVQQFNIAQIAIDKKLTLISWENMHYRSDRSRTHIFQKNNEMAGYCGVQHALQLRGIDGNFGISRKVIVLSMGSVSRGAIYALKGHGFDNITVYTQRPPFLVSDKLPGIIYEQMLKDATGKLKTVDAQGRITPFIDKLTSADIIVNGILQKTNNPINFIDDNDIEKFKRECLVIDISCDNHMGFSFAHPTGLSSPLAKVGNITYYSVDHTPTLLWDSASWEISKCITPYLVNVVEQTENEVINDAVDIRNGIILNKNILSFQNRSAIYPYAPLSQLTSQKQIPEETSDRNTIPITISMQNFKNII